ncbi:MAG: sodium:proton antiporter [Alphaproteobacteria bacterium]|nr:sodium:proton antiporter [Alphaproteobacteria bacterium]
MTWGTRLFPALTAGLALLGPDAAWASEAAAAHGALPHVNGAAMGFLWVLPFVGILLSIALMPLWTPHFWHHHFGKVSAFWAAAFIVPYALQDGLFAATYQLAHTALQEYIPFIILLLALFTVAGGVRLKGTLVGTPEVNTLMLLVGTVIASWTGTTGASMLLIRPLIRALENRKYKVHVIVFFIFLVSNIGGALTPLGDPPLFLGFLKGVDFFWPTTHLFVPTVFSAGVLLVLFFVIDKALYAKEGPAPKAAAGSGESLGIDGKINILFLAAIVGAVLMSGLWRPGVNFTIYHVDVALENVARDVLLLLIATVSYKMTTQENRDANGFSWDAIKEVAKLFAGIFVSMIPAIAILRAGKEGALGSVVGAVTAPDGSPINAAYFWFTGALSSFLDNAPTYLVFFNTAGGDAATLMSQHPGTLAAISAGAVFMGANSYIGNAPNFMVRSIAEEKGVAMPSFFGYMIWSVGILVPLFILDTFLFF